MSIINKARLQKYLGLNYNVLFRGRHGVGKTAIIKQVFEEAGLKWKYFSASTLDPWVDFVGTPKVIDRPDGNSYLTLIRPEFIMNDDVEAIFLDEFNRAPDKVINAVMELLQFKSINGHRLKNLKVIWAAINPEDDEDTYTVNHIDPAHLDRFQVQLDVPFKVDEDYFLNKYPITGRTFLTWWNAIPGEIRFEISPRRLDYAADAHENQCRLEDFLPKNSGVKKLRDMLQTLPLIERMKTVTLVSEAEEILKDVNNVTMLMDLVKAKEVNSVKFFDTFGKLINKELTAPFVDVMIAIKNGKETYSTVEELIEKLPVDEHNRGTLATAVAINNIDVDTMFQRGGNLKTEIERLPSHVLSKLSNRIYDLIVRCDAKTLERQLWGVRGKSANLPTNLHVIMGALAKKAGTFSATQGQKINEKLLSNKIIDQNII